MDQHGIDIVSLQPLQADFNRGPDLIRAIIRAAVRLMSEFRIDDSIPAFAG